MAQIREFKVEPRSVGGKGKLNALRRAGFVPGNVYGGGRESLAIVVPARALPELLSHSSSTTLIDLKIGDSDVRRCFLRKVQYAPVKSQALHLDFYAVDMASVMKASVAIVGTGESPAARAADAMIQHPLAELHVEGRPGDLPERIVVDLSGLTEIDQAIHVRDLALPDGVRALDDPDQIVFKVQLVRGAAETEAPAAASAEAEAEPAGEADASGTDASAPETPAEG